MSDVTPLHAHRGPAAPEEVAAFLADTGTAELLRAAYALTHRIHEAEQAPVTAARTRGDYATDLRAQRDLITAEVLTRTGACQCCDGRC